MDYRQLFQNGSLKFISNFVAKIVRDGFGCDLNQIWVQQVVLLVSSLMVVFLLYKLAWLVWKIMKFIISCLEW